MSDERLQVLQHALVAVADVVCTPPSARLRQSAHATAHQLVHFAQLQSGSENEEDLSSELPTQSWLARAKLAIRLQRPEEAVCALKIALRQLELSFDFASTRRADAGESEQLDWRYLEVCTLLMHQLAACGQRRISEALAAAHRLLEVGSFEVSVSDAELIVPSREVTDCVYQMVAAHGLQQVRTAQRVVGLAHPAIDKIFREVVQWNVRGFDK